MGDVQPFCVGPQYRTEVWVSRRALKDFVKHAKRAKGPAGRLRDLIHRFAEGGFEKWEGKGSLVDEGDNVWRLGHRSSLFRLLGFYGESKHEFIIIADGKKPGQKRGRRLDDAVKIVASIRKSGNWRKVNNE